MTRLLRGSTLGIALGVLISILFSLIFADGNYDPVNPYSFMGEIYNEHLTEIQTFIIAVVIWILLGITFSTSSLVFSHLRYTRVKTTMLHFIIMLFIFFPLAILAGWFPFKISAIVIFIIIFVVIYVVIWKILNTKNQKDIEAINKQLKKQRTD